MRSLRAIPLAAAATVAMAGGSMAVATMSADAATTSAVAKAPRSNWFGAAPYVMPLENNPPDLARVMAATGQKSFMFAFILAPNGGGCRPTWDGTAPVSSDTAVGAKIDSVRSLGGDVEISIGGYGGTKLGQTCASPAATAAAYQQVITKYRIKAVDFDLETPEYNNAKAIENEIGAAQILQRNNPGLYVSITTAGTAAGTTYQGQQLLNTAKRRGFTPDNYSIMPFDGGFEAGAAAQIRALEAFHGTLRKTFGWNSTTAYAHEGVSLMNGRSDTGEFFRQADFQKVLDYATSKKLGRYTYWSVNRDRQCATPEPGTTSARCSSVKQREWDFTKFTAKFGAVARQPAGRPPHAA